MKIQLRCLVCTHEQIEQIHDDRYNQQKSFADLSRKFFPDRKPKDLARSFSTHFTEHFNIDEDLAAIQVNQQLNGVQTLPAVVKNTERVGIEMSKSQERVYTAALKKRISSTGTMEASIRTLMEIVNHITDEWAVMHDISRCDTCGRDDNKETLGKLLLTMKELREQHAQLMKIRNPAEVFRKFFEQSFVKFSEQIMGIFMEKLREKGRIVSETINQYLRGEVSAAYLSRKIAEMKDFGGEELEYEVKDQFRRIFQNVKKEMDVSF